MADNPLGNALGIARAYQPTLRERTANLLQDLVERFGGDRYFARKIGETIAGGPGSNLPMRMGLLDPTPVGSMFQRQETPDAAPNMPPGMGGVNMAATVFHGSPHRFDKFDSKKIGTGEGAQAYGHGLYLAESPAVAKSYSTLTPSGGAQPAPVRLFQGQELSPGSPEYHAGTLVANSTLAKARKDVASWIAEGSPDPNLVAGWQRTLDTLNKAKSKADFKVGPSGNLYSVDLPDPVIARMLDWDKPLSQQAPEVRQALAPYVEGMKWEPPRGDSNWALKRPDGSTMLWRSEREGGGGNVQDFIGNMRGETIYKLFKGATPDDVSATLRQAGIPGIRYLDGGSRGAGVGTSNYVVFPGEENVLRILERNGVPLK